MAPSPLQKRGRRKTGGHRQGCIKKPQSLGPGLSTVAGPPPLPDASARRRTSAYKRLNCSDPFQTRPDPTPSSGSETSPHPGRRFRIQGALPSPGGEIRRGSGAGTGRGDPQTGDPQTGDGSRPWVPGPGRSLELVGVALAPGFPFGCVSFSSFRYLDFERWRSALARRSRAARDALVVEAAAVGGRRCLRRRPAEVPRLRPNRARARETNQHTTRNGRLSERPA